MPDGRKSLPVLVLPSILQVMSIYFPFAAKLDVAETTSSAKNTRMSLFMMLCLGVLEFSDEIAAMKPCAQFPKGIK